MLSEPGGDGNIIRIELEKDLTLRSIDKILEYIYLYNCFTSVVESGSLLDFCYFVQEGSLQTTSLDKSIDGVTKYTCVNSYRLGHALKLPPLKRKAWKTAIELGLISQVGIMLKCSKSYLDQPINTNHQPALHVSIDKGYESLAKLLIDNKADHSLRDYQGKSALGLTAWYGLSGLIEWLIEAGAKVNTSDMWGQTPLHKACARGHDVVVGILLKNSADVNCRSKSGRTALHMAAMGGKTDYDCR